MVRIIQLKNIVQHNFLINIMLKIQQKLRVTIF